jgi:YebC/PmpR family DNA-binding regulatory protein
MGRKFEVRKASMMKTGLAKSRLYSRFGKEIYMCAKNGGANPDANWALKHLIDKAKKEQVPSDIIKRNIQKAEKGTGEDFSSIRYEGFGPGGTGIIVDTLTDNVNRTVSEVRAAFTKVGCSLGVNGSVVHGYNHLSYITVSGMSEEEVFETLLMADLDILEIEEEDGQVEIEANGYDKDKIQQALTEASDSVEIVEAESGWYPLEYITLDEPNKAAFDKMMDMLNESDDVQEIYHNVKEEN